MCDWITWTGNVQQANNIINLDNRECFSYFQNGIFVLLFLHSAFQSIAFKVWNCFFMQSGACSVDFGPSSIPDPCWTENYRERRGRGGEKELWGRRGKASTREEVSVHYKVCLSVMGMPSRVSLAAWNPASKFEQEGDEVTEQTFVALSLSLSLPLTLSLPLALAMLIPTPLPLVSVERFSCSGRARGGADFI